MRRSQSQGAVRTRLLVKLSTVHTSPEPDTVSQPPQPPNVPLGEAVTVTVVPLVKDAVQTVAVGALQIIPVGEKVIVPEPLPGKSTVMEGPAPPPPVPVKQIT